ncbi:MAG: sugar phosphate isomerase/epimerase family protein [Planctomycetota bacterium]
MKCSIQHRIALVTVMMLLISFCFSVASQGSEPVSEMACRLANYRQFQDTAWTHLPSIGFKNVFMDVPSPDQVEATKRKLAKHSLTALVLRGNTDLARPSSVGELAVQLEICEKMGVKYMFLSPKHPGVRAGDIARKHGVTISLETHPDLGTNGDTHLETMKQINHPNVRVNFDTGNITYYNKNTDAATELKKVIDYVATVEFKEHNGRYRTWNFPTFGKGVVNFPSVLRILKEHNYRGPITLEIEGIQGVPWDEAQTKKAIADSAAYVKSLGRFGRLIARTYMRAHTIRDSNWHTIPITACPQAATAGYTMCFLRNHTKSAHKCTVTTRPPTKSGIWAISRKRAVKKGSKQLLKASRT